MTPIRNAATICTVVGALLATAALADTASAQAPAGSSSATPLAVGLVSSGVAEAQAIEAIREGVTPTTFVAPGELDTLSRRHLRETFRSVAVVQTRVDRAWLTRLPD